MSCDPIGITVEGVEVRSVGGVTATVGWTTSGDCTNLMGKVGSVA